MNSQLYNLAKAKQYDDEFINVDRRINVPNTKYGIKGVGIYNQTENENDRTVTILCLNGDEVKVSGRFRNHGDDGD